MSTYPGQQTVIYQADPAVIQHLHSVKNSLHNCCKPYINHKAKVQTMDGMMHEGVISGIDSHYLFLQVTVTEETRQFYNPYYPPRPRPPYPYPYPYPHPYPYPYPYPYYNNVILPLALFDLLAVALI